jgi:hypothetical protein
MPCAWCVSTVWRKRHGSYIKRMCGDRERGGVNQLCEESKKGVWEGARGRCMVYWGLR